MGLDAVEIILRIEDLFTITIPDEEVGTISTVGDLYRLICSKLNVLPLASPIAPPKLPHLTDKTRKFLFTTNTPLPAPPELLPWSSQTVWDALVTILVDHQGFDQDEVLYGARLNQDLGID